jgi:hypothetical protein
MKKHLEYEVLLNCILIESDVRECFLFWCRKTLKIKKFITKLFPDLVINKYSGFNNFQEKCDVLLISKRIVNPEEYDTEAKLGKLLGYLGANDFIKLNRDIIVYDYVLKASINDTEIYIYNELCQNQICHEEIRKKAEIALTQNKFGYEIKDVKVTERIIIPIIYIINKLKKNIILTDNEYNELYNYLWNENMTEIYNRNLFNNKFYINFITNFLLEYRNEYMNESIKNEYRAKYNEIYIQ